MSSTGSSGFPTSPWKRDFPTSRTSTGCSVPVSAIRRAAYAAAVMRVNDAAGCLHPMPETPALRYLSFFGSQADAASSRGYVRLVPKADSCSAAKAVWLFEDGDPRDVAARPVEAGDVALPDRVGTKREHNRNSGGRRLGSQNRCTTSRRCDHGNLAAD